MKPKDYREFLIFPVKFSPPHPHPPSPFQEIAPPSIHHLSQKSRNDDSISTTYPKLNPCPFILIATHPKLLLSFEQAHCKNFTNDFHSFYSYPLLPSSSSLSHSLSLTPIHTFYRQQRDLLKLQIG